MLLKSVHLLRAHPEIFNQTGGIIVQHIYIVQFEIRWTRTGRIASRKCASQLGTGAILIVCRAESELIRLISVMEFSNF